MPAAVMDFEAPSSSEKHVTESVMDEVQSSAPNLLFEGSLDPDASSEIFNDMPDLKQESTTTKSVNCSNLEYSSPIGPLHRSPKDIESPAAFHGCCGFYNLGNTCFMNAGLQCLFCNTHLVKFFHEQFLLNDVSKDTLTGKFCQLVRKVWSGNFSLIHPLDFKGTLGMYYPQFHDFRQHDCQEFVTLLLDSLHESLNNSRNNNNNNNNAFQKPMQATSSKSKQITHPSSLEMSSSSSSSINIIPLKSPSTSSVSSSSSYSTKHAASAAVATETENVESVATAATATTTASTSPSLTTLNQNNSHVFSVPYEQQDGNTATGVPSSPKLPNLASASALDTQSKSSTLISNTSNCDPQQQQQQQQPSNSTITATTPGVRVVHQGCSSGHKKPFHYTPNQLYTQGPNHQFTMVSTATNTTTTSTCSLAAAAISSNVTDIAAGFTTSSTLEDCENKVVGVKSQREFSTLVRNFDRSPQKEMNQCITPDNYISSSTQLFPASSANRVPISSEAATNNRQLVPVSSFQNDGLCARDDLFLVHSTNMNEADAVGPKCLPNLEDFYAKEMKTLNTNVLVSELEEQIQTDSDKFVKSDNRNRLNAENCDNNLEQILGAEAAKADLGPGQEKIKDINIRLDKKSRSCQHFPSPSCKSGLRHEDWSNINNIKRIKIEADGDEKNIKRQALQKFNLDQSTLRVEEIMADSGCRMGEEEEEEEQEEDMVTERDEDADADDALLEDEEAEVGSGAGEQPCRMSPLRESPGPDADYTAADIEEADHSWGRHLIKNNSIVVDTFHGQFKNTVVCSECCHVSVTYEPFMYLSVPIPHAMERQLCVIFMPQVRSMPPVRYLLNLNKNDNIYKAKTELRKVASQPDCDIILVEVVDSHITRVLDDNILLRFVNDSARKIYAFEMAAPPNSLDSSPTDSMGDLSAVSSSFPAKEDLATVQPCSSTSPDIFSNMDTFTLDSFTPPSTPSATVALSTASNSSVNTTYAAGSTNTVTASSSCKLKTPPPSASGESIESAAPIATTTDEAASGTSKCFSTTTSSSSSSSVFPDSAMKEDSDLCDSSVTPQQQQSSSHSKSEVNVTNSPNMWDWPPPVPSPSGVAIPMTWEPHLDTCDQPQQQPIVSSSSLPPMAEHWRSCAICLEELLDTGLMVHASCGGTFCHSCLEMSLKHHSVFSYTCPVCLAFANPSVEFVPLADPESKRLRTRILAVPIAFRCLRKTDPNQLSLVGHPHILYLPNNISGNVLYSCVDQVVPTQLDYTIVYTTEEGLQCSRCPSFNHCRGCIVQRMGRITLQPGDHLTVMLSNISTKQLDELMQQYVIDHESMESLRPDTPMTIYDCFKAFMQSETLDEHNPWYCPSCCKNCRAKKTMTVWRYPDNLIIYLKRFVFHELTSTKIDNLVSFPLEQLDLGEFSSGPRTKHLLYDLHSIVCHFGGSNSGHYTCYAKHPREDVWYYYNDETVCQQIPRDDHMSSAYVLFYVRQGTDVSFQIPDKASYQFVDSGLNNSPTYNNATALQKPLNSGLSKGSDQSMALVLYQPPPRPPPPAPTSTVSPSSSSSSSSLLSCQRVVETSNCSATKDSDAGPAESTSTASSEQVEPDSTYDFYS